MSTEETTRLARRVSEDIATDRDLHLIDEVLAEDFVEHCLFGETVYERDEARDHMQSFLEAFPDFEATVHRIITEEDLVEMHIKRRGTHDGEFMGVDPTGNKFESETMVFTRITGGRIAERWVQPDLLSLFQLETEEVPNRL